MKINMILGILRWLHRAQTETYEAVVFQMVNYVPATHRCFELVSQRIVQ